MLGKVLRIVGIVLLALTSVLVLVGGIGTYCVAFNPTGFGPIFAKIAPFQWLYILFVVAGVAIGVLGIVAMIRLIKGKPGSYRLAVITLVAGLITGVIHVIASRALRGSSMPADPIMWVNALTLAVFLLFRVPSIWNKVNFERKDDHTSGLGTAVAMIAIAPIILTVQWWAGPTHMLDGINYADVWHLPMAIVGWTLLLAGGAVIGRYILTDDATETALAPVVVAK